MSERTASEQTVVLPVWARTFSSLQYRDFCLYWCGTFGCNAGYWMRTLAQSWLVLELTDSAFLLGLSNFALTIPVLLLALVGGFAADTLDRRKLLIVALLIGGILVLLLAVLTSTGLVNISLIIAISLLGGVAQAFEMPSRHAIVPTLVPPRDLMNAIALNSAVWQVTRIVGPAAAGILMGVIGVDGCLYLAAGSYLTLVLSLILMKVPPKQTVKHGSMFETIGDGLGYLRSNRTMSTLILMEAVPAIFASPVQVLLAVFARDILQVGQIGLGALNSTAGVGALIGTLVLASLGGFRHRGLLLLCAAIALGVSLILFGGILWYHFALAILVVVGCAQMTYLSTTNTLVQSYVKEEFRGRVMSVYTMAYMGLMPVGALQAGFVAEQFGAPFAVILGGAVMAVFAIGILISQPNLRRLP